MLTLVEEPGKLPPWWDVHFKEHHLLSRLFLDHLFRTNEIPQKYFWRQVNSAIEGAGCLCRGQLPFKIGGKTLFCGVSCCSIPMPLGFETGFSPEDGLESALMAMDMAWPGFQMILGLKKKDINIPGWSLKRHFLSVDIPIDFCNFDDYLNRLRHVYRRPIVSSLKKWQGVTIGIVKKEEFTLADYSLYIQLLKKLGLGYNALSYEFFRNMPLEHFYIKAAKDGMTLGWIAVVQAGSQYYPLFVGIDQRTNRIYDTYSNIFIETIKAAIKNDISVIRMGQTAEMAKMRLGGYPSERYILVRHTNPAVNWIVKNTDIFNFRKQYKPMHVFKKTGEKS